MRLTFMRKTEYGNRRLGLSWLCAMSFIALGLLVPQPGLAAWSSDPIAVAAGAGEQRRPQVVCDLSGGYYVAWQDHGVGMFAQHYDAQGNATWATPVQLSTTTDSYLQQESTADGSGGLIVAWNEYPYTRVQRVRLNGSLVWPAGGVAVINDSEPWIAADGTGGVIVMSYYGKVNRVAADGTLPWGDADNPLSYSTSSSATKIVADGAGGAILMWSEYSLFKGVAVQRINAGGDFLWNEGNPVQVSGEGTSSSCPRLIAQGGGAIVIWYTGDEVRAQKLNASGAIQWTAGGVVAASGESPYNVDLAGDGSGGAFITWADYNTYAVRAQYINNSGQVVWESPVAMTSESNYYDNANHPRHTVADGQGGFITTWVNDNEEIKAQRCNAAGTLAWTATGAVLATGSSNYYPPKLACNGQGGAAVVWVDYSSETGTDIYLQGVSASGVAGNPGYTPPPAEDDSSSCFVSTLGTGSSAAHMLLFLFAGVVGLVAMRRR